MERWRGRVAVVTGGSSGIGAAIAYQLQDAGVNVVAVARRHERIREAVEAARNEAKSRGRDAEYKAPTPGQLHCLKCDVCKEDDIQSVFQWVKENTKGVDILVNNAGVVGDTTLTETNTSDWKRVLDINVLGLSICTREAVQQMKARGLDEGHIVHISSIAGLSVYPARPQFSVYAASKNAVRVLTEGLRRELVAANSRIRVTEISPGVVKTDIVKHTKIDEAQFFGRPFLQPEDVAEAVLFALRAPPHVQIHEMVVLPVGQK
ncbi:hypothetical protein R5R35_009510 [Gryllus longicercus]|uniref:Ketoreductase domain-containing protein n=1 Tax=Gryllus longicercus TaxID=2509291 RepID=A0AAN9VNG3_9ORTH